MNAAADTHALEAERQAALYRRVADLEADQVEALRLLDLVEDSFAEVVRARRVAQQLGLRPGEARLLLALADAAPTRTPVDDLRRLVRTRRSHPPVTAGHLKVLVCHVRSAVDGLGLGDVIGSAYRTPFYWMSEADALAVRRLLGEAQP